MRIIGLITFLIAMPLSGLLAQTADLQINVVYMCTPPTPNFKVFSCNSTTGACDFQNYKNGQANQRGEALRVQLVAALSKCHVQTPAEAESSPQRGEAPAKPAPFAPRAASAPSPPPPPSQAASGGFKVGDTVRVLAGGGWGDAKVLQVRGSVYYVRLENGIEISKTWPLEVRRAGKLTAEDHALGQYDLHEWVEVLVNGKWMKGEVVGQDLNMYTIQLPGERTTALDGDRTVRAGPENLRPSTAPVAATRPAGQAPKGLVSCPAKYEGRWGLSAGVGGMTVVFRSGKVTITEGLGGPMEFECWMGGGKIIPYKAGSLTPFAYGFDINNDGTLESPLGELKKKGN